MPENSLKKHWPILTLIATVILAYVGSAINFHSMIVQQTNVLNVKIDAANKDLFEKLARIETRATKLEGAVKTLGDQQSDPLKTVIHDLLASAAYALPQKPEVAARAIGVADGLLATLMKEKRPAEPEYFQQTISVMNELNQRIPRSKTTGDRTEGTGLRTAVYSTKISLAKYRSVLESVPPIAGLTWLIFTPDATSGQFIKGPIHLNQVNFDFSFLGQREAIKIVPPLKGLLSENVVVENAYIKGGYDVLDGIHWRNVVFIGSHIIYRGGELELRNVRFVNCTFEVPPSEHGDKFVNYAALANQFLMVPG